jgi:hypothetical protein
MERNVPVVQMSMMGQWKIFIHEFKAVARVHPLGVEKAQRRCFFYVVPVDGSPKYLEVSERKCQPFDQTVGVSYLQNNLQYEKFSVLSGAVGIPSVEMNQDIWWWKVKFGPSQERKTCVRAAVVFHIFRMCAFKY